MSGVLIKFDRERKLKYTINTLTDFEELMGLSVLQVMSDPSQASSFRIIRAFVWAGLKWETFKLTVDAAGALMQIYFDNGGTIGELVGCIKDALVESGVLRAPSDAEETEPTEEAYEGNAPEVTE